MTEKVTEQSRTERKRCAILRAAVEEFQANGFQATSMDRVAERANVSKRTIYNHFSSKEALFDAITCELVEKIVNVTEVCYDPERPLEEQLGEIARRKVSLMSSPKFLGLAKVTISEHLRAPDLASDTYCKIREGEDGLLCWIREACEDGRISVDDPVFAADQFSALLSGMVFWPAVFGRPEPDENELDKIVEATVTMFLARYAAVGAGVPG